MTDQSRRYFVFLYVESPQLQQLFDLAIFALNPDEKWRAHVTLAGPYTDARKLPRRTEYKKRVSTMGAGRFSLPGQNTVYLDVGAADLQDFWNKPDYPFHPHLTLYDGNDADVADKLLTRLLDIRMFLKFYVSRVHVVSAIKGQGSMELMQAVNPCAIFETKRMSVEGIKTLSGPERFDIAISALQRAKYVSMQL